MKLTVSLLSVTLIATSISAQHFDPTEKRRRLSPSCDAYSCGSCTEAQCGQQSGACEWSWSSLSQVYECQTACGGPYNCYYCNDETRCGQQSGLCEWSSESSQCNQACGPTNCNTCNETRCGQQSGSCEWSWNPSSQANECRTACGPTSCNTCDETRCAQHLGACELLWNSYLQANECRTACGGPHNCGYCDATRCGQQSGECQWSSQLSSCQQACGPSSCYTCNETRCGQQSGACQWSSQTSQCQQTCSSSSCYSCNATQCTHQTGFCAWKEGNCQSVCGGDRATCDQYTSACQWLNGGCTTLPPSLSPTYSPTGTPITSFSPTAAPSSSSPSLAPSSAPSSAPSESPSTSTPSQAPSKAPTANGQTPVPTSSGAPTKAPETTTPSAAPSQSPASNAPTASPTTRPTTSPVSSSLAPTASPTPPMKICQGFGNGDDQKGSSNIPDAFRWCVLKLQPKTRTLSVFEEAKLAKKKITQVIEYDGQNCLAPRECSAIKLINTVRKPYDDPSISSSTNPPFHEYYEENMTHRTPMFHIHNVTFRQICKPHDPSASVEYCGPELPSILNGSDGQTQQPNIVNNEHYILRMIYGTVSHVTFDRTAVSSKAGQVDTVRGGALQFLASENDMNHHFRSGSASRDGLAMVKGCFFRSNVNQESAGAIYCDGHQTGLVKASSFLSNKVGMSHNVALRLTGGAIVIEHAAGYNDGFPINIDACYFNGNAFINKAYFGDESSETSRGGAIYYRIKLNKYIAYNNQGKHGEPVARDSMELCGNDEASFRCIRPTLPEIQCPPGMSPPYFWPYYKESCALHHSTNKSSCTCVYVMWNATRTRNCELGSCFQGIRIRGTSFVRNTGGKGGAIYLNGNFQPYQKLPHPHDDVMRLEDCKFKSSVAEKESGGAIAANVRMPMLTKACTFTSCRALVDGGAIKFEYASTKSLQSCVFEGCVAQIGGGASIRPAVDSKGTFAYGGRIWFNASTFSSCVAKASGGALALDGHVNLLDVIGCHFESNRAPAGSVFFILGISNITAVNFSRSVTFKSNPVPAIVWGTASVSPIWSWPSTTCQAGFYATSIADVEGPDKWATTFEGSDACPLRCPTGRYASGSSSSSLLSVQCSKCPLGFVGAPMADTNSSATCTECPAGWHAKPSQTTDCMPTAVGRYARDTGEHPDWLNCPSGFYQRREKQPLCDECAVGSYCNATTATTCLEQGVYCPGGAAGKSLCPIGHECPKSMSKDQCEKGSFSNRTGLTDCILCPQGWIQDQKGKSNCSSCGIGKFQDVTGVSVCKDCPRGRFRGDTDSTAATLCKKCPVGWAQDQNGEGSCITCSVGEQQDVAGMSVCKACMIGRFRDDSNATTGSACVDCPHGWVQSESRRKACKICNGGEFQDVVGESVCKACAAGSFRGVFGATICKTCPQGFFQGEQGEETCKSCNKGQVQESAGMAICKECIAGRFRVNSFSECNNCPTNHVASTGRLEQCQACPESKYQEKEGESICKQCGIGTFLVNGTDGDLRCGECSAGMYVKQSRCVACPEGTYAATASESCAACPVGYESLTGSQARIFCKPCPRCPAGTFNTDLATCGRCANCPAGFAGTDGSCRACKSSTSPGAYQSSPNKTACLQCSANAVGDKASFEASENGTACECADGYYFDDARASKHSAALACTLCDKNQALCCQSFSSPFLRNRAGFWAVPSAPGVLYKCPVAPACIGVEDKTSTCAEAASESFSSNATALCRQGHTGPVCGVCEDLWKPGINGLCQDCSSVLRYKSTIGKQTVKLVIVVIVSAMVLGAVAAFELRIWKDSESLEKIKRTEAMVGTFGNFRERANVLLPYVQRIGAIDIALPAITLPNAPKIILDFLKMLYASIARIFIAIDPCELHVSFFDDLVLQVALLPWFVLVLVGAYALVAAITRTSKRPWHKLETKARLIGIAMFGAKFLHPGISLQALKVFVCSAYGEETYMAADLAYRCDDTDAEYQSLVAISTVAILFLVIGIPAGLLIMVMLDRRHQQSDAAVHASKASKHMLQLFHRDTMMERFKRRASAVHHTSVRRIHEAEHSAVAPFVASTRDQFYWMFVVDMGMSFVFIALLGVLARTQTEAQITLSIFMAVIQLPVPAVLRPFKDDAHTRAAIIGAVTYGIFQLTALTKYFIEGQKTGLAVEAAAKASKLETIDGILNVVFVFGSLFLFAAAVPGVLEYVWFDCRCIAKIRGLGKSKRVRVVPVSGNAKAKVVSVALAGKSSQGTTLQLESSRVFAEAESEHRLDKLPAYIARAPNKVLLRLELDKLNAYISTYRAMHDLHAAIMVTAIQAMVRGKHARQDAAATSVDREHPSTQEKEDLIVEAFGEDELGGLAGVAHGDAERVAELERSIFIQREAEKKLEAALAEERQKEHELEVELAQERKKERKLEQQLSSMKLRMVDTQLVKAADKEEAKRIMSAHESEVAEHREQLREEQERRTSMSQARHKKRRFKRVLATLRRELGGRSDDEIRALLDKNGSGTIEVTELWGLIKDLTLASGHAMTKDDARALLNEFDGAAEDGGDGVVTVDELLGGLRGE